VGQFGGKWRPSVGKVGEWYMERRHLKRCSPAVSLKTGELAPPSKY
jgi:hypothetical protein